jgi:hypothetical protein
MDQVTQELMVPRGRHRLHVDFTPGVGPPVVLMHGFPDNTHLYDRLLPYLTGRQPVVRFDFLGWGRSDKPDGYPYTATNQVGDLAAVIDALPGLLDGRAGRPRGTRRLRATGDRLGAGQPVAGGRSRTAQHVLPLDSAASPPAGNRPVLHTAATHRGTGSRPPAARPGPATLRVAGRPFHRRPARPPAVGQAPL